MAIILDSEGQIIGNTDCTCEDVENGIRHDDFKRPDHCGNCDLNRPGLENLGCNCKASNYGDAFDPED